MTLCLWPPGEDGSDSDALIARAFGVEMTDLTVDFDGPVNAAIDGVLRCCLSRPDGTPIDGKKIGGWHLSKRRQGLLAVAVATKGARRFVTTSCDAPGCGEKLDLELDLLALRQDWRGDHVEFSGGRLRLPRPADLESLDSDAPYTLATVLFEGVPPEREGWEREAEQVLSAADPLGDLELRAECYNCGAPIALPLSLEGFLLSELATTVTRLLDEIHVLAFAYHWTETQIMALPEARRHHYLARIQEAWAV
jgi:hypothetical protein